MPGSLNFVTGLVLLISYIHCFLKRLPETEKDNSDDEVHTFYLEGS